MEEVTNSHESGTQRDTTSGAKEGGKMRSSGRPTTTKASLRKHFDATTSIFEELLRRLETLESGVISQSMELSGFERKFDTLVHNIEGTRTKLTQGIVYVASFGSCASSFLFRFLMLFRASRNAQKRDRKYFRMLWFKAYRWVVTMNRFKVRKLAQSPGLCHIHCNVMAERKGNYCH